MAYTELSKLDGVKAYVAPISWIYLCVQESKTFSVVDYFINVYMVYLIYGR